MSEKRKPLTTRNYELPRCEQCGSVRVKIYGTKEHFAEGTDEPLLVRRSLRCKRCAFKWVGFFK